MKPLFACEIPGRCFVKKNTKRVVGHGKGKRAIYSERFLFWEKVAQITLAKFQASKIAFPIELHLVFHFKNRRAEPDVSNLVEGPQDVLKKMGIIADDKLVHRLVAEKVFGDHVEKTEVRIFPYK